MIFDDREDAGRQLAAALVSYRTADVVVFGLPRGGVPVAALVAHALRAPLDVIIVGKLGVPFQPELAFGAVGEDGVEVIDEDIVRFSELTADEVSHITERETAKVADRARRFRRPGTAPARLIDKVALIVDDGVATGSTARAACQVARAHGAQRVVLAVPVGPPQTLRSLAQVADDVVCLHSPITFEAVGQYYRDFTQVSDDTVIRLLDRERPQSVDPRC